MKTLFSIFLTLFSLTVFSQEIPRIPPKSNDFVNDYANVLSPSDEDDLRSIAKSIETESSAQVVIVITDDVDKEYSIEQFSIDLAQAWGIGQRQADNGVLIIVMPKNRKGRIEVGYGLEGDLTDAWTRQLQARNFGPNFKHGDYYKGLAASLREIKQQISPTAKEQKRQLALQQEKESEEAAAAFGNFMLWFLIIAVVGGLIGWLIYSQIAKQRKIEEENRRREEEKERAKQRIINAAQSAENRLKTDYSNIRTNLLKMGTFQNADKLLPEIESIYKDALSTLEDAKYDDYPNLLQTPIASINALARDAVSKYETREKVIKTQQNFETNKSTYRSKIQNARQIVHELFRVYEPTIWSNSTLMTEFQRKTSDLAIVFERLTHQYHSSVTDVQADNYQSATSKMQQANVDLSYYIDICGLITSKETEINNTVTKLSQHKQLDYLSKKVKEVNDYVRNNSSDIDSYNKTSWNNYVRQTDFNISTTSRNPILELSRVEGIAKKIKEYFDKFKSDVRDEEDRRRRQREDLVTATAIATSYTSSSRSDDSSSSNDTSFGGGSFGGGGSSSDW